VRRLAVQAAASDTAARLLDRLMDIDDAPRPRMPRIQNFAFLGPVGVLDLRCTIAAAVIPRSVISRPSSTSDATTKAPSIPTHASVPSCLRPSRTSPSGGPKMRPFLTPAAHDGRIVVRVGTEEWRRRGPNKRMDQRRTKCRQIGYPDPNSATVHQIGAGPLYRSLPEAAQRLALGKRLSVCQ